MKTKASKTPDNLLNTQIHFGGQNSDYRQTLIRKINGKNFVIRLHIHTDSHIPQAQAKAEVFSEKDCGWNAIAHILPHNMKSDPNIGYVRATDDQKKMTFNEDRDALLRLATETLEAAYAPTGPSHADLLDFARTVALGNTDADRLQEMAQAILAITTPEVKSIHT